MKRLLKNTVYLVLIAAILFIASSVYEKSISGGEIQGDTPLEKTENIIDYLNQQEDFQGFGEVFLSDIDYQSSTWYYTIMVRYPMEEVNDDQALSMKYFSLLGEVITKTSSLEFVKEINIGVMFVDWRGVIVYVNEEGVKGTRKFPQDWPQYRAQEPAGLLPLSLLEERQGGGSK